MFNKKEKADALLTELAKKGLDNAEIAEVLKEALIIHTVYNCDYYWIINQNTYYIDDVKVPKGKMRKLYKEHEPITNENWRKATPEEVRTKKWHKGNYFNLINL